MSDKRPRKKHEDMNPTYEQISREVEEFHARMIERYGAFAILTLWRVPESMGDLSGGTRRGDELTAYAMARHYTRRIEHAWKLDFDYEAEEEADEEED